MGNAIWLGHAAGVAQVQRAPITAGGTWANNDTATMTINGKDVVFTLVTEANTRSDILTNLATLLNASTIPEFEEITWANYSNTHIQGTADTAGQPFTATNSEVTAGDGTFGDFAVSTKNAGPYSANTADNWSTGATPVNNDAVIFENSDVDCKYDLGTLSAFEPASITIKQSYTGRIGLPRVNVDGGTADDDKYVEYRSRYLAFAPTAVNIGEGEGNGSGRIMLEVGQSSAPAITVFNKSTRAETGIPCVLITGGNNDCSLIVLKGDVGLAFFGGEVADVTAGCKISYTDNRLGDSSVICGDGLTFGNITQSGGRIEFEDNVTALTQERDCEATVRGAATIGTLTIDGKFYDYGTGGITTLHVYSDGDFDHSRSMDAKTITSVHLYGTAKYRDPNGVLTETNDFDLQRTRLQAGSQPGVLIEKPAHRNVAFGTIS